MLLRLGALALAAAALTACGGHKKAAPTPQLPPGCSVPEAEKVVTDFLAAPSFAPQANFDVYATYESDKHSFVAHLVPKALAFLHARRKLGERNRLISLRVGKLDFNNARITFSLTRYAPDFAKRGIHTRLSKGAGTIDCAHQKIAAWVQKGP
ncbi:MAG TPA: hypothetical protein VGQ38_17530 [Gaiellaceae bacterium]|nr:hypothetical protein [Gaiellaceae bacterium]